MDKKTVIIMLLCFVFVVGAGVGTGFLAGNILKSKPVEEITMAALVEESTEADLVSESEEDISYTVTSEETSVEYIEEAAFDEEQIYEEYWNNGGYKNLMIFSNDQSVEGVEISSVFADIDKDGVKELFISLVDTQANNIRCDVQEQALLDIEDGFVKIVLERQDTGASTGGSSLMLKYNTKSGRHVLVENEFSRFGAMHSSSDYIIYSAENGFASPSVTFSEIYTGDSMDIEVVKGKTSLYSESEMGLTYYKKNEEYISEYEYEELKNSYVEPTDSEYVLKTVDFNNIIN